MKVIGKTDNGTKIVSEVFKMFDSTGLPLDVIFDQCKENDLMPSWLDFYKEASNQGWKDKTIFNRLETNISDVWGKDFYLNVKNRLLLHIGS